ncbi:hypothetical protein [Streptomyces sp. L2]|uniref:hypothetical protein n=1 Tax=Streptomyces sp. L2 TaxID=2162665 RepID=UPI001010F0D0|nr:hypothetical protein [Streptomyces sp. L2]
MSTPSPGFRPTHVVPPNGMPAWEEPDPARATVSLDALLPVLLEEWLGDWARIRCANGWGAWVDGRLLVAVPRDPPATPDPDGTTADPQPLLDRVTQALDAYRAAVAERAAGGLDGESFRDRTSGLRIGIVVDGESMWLYDPDEERWLYGDGHRLGTYATDRPEPSAEPREHTPTRVVAPDGER